MTTRRRAAAVLALALLAPACGSGPLDGDRAVVAAGGGLEQLPAPTSTSGDTAMVLSVSCVFPHGPAVPMGLPDMGAAPSVAEAAVTYRQG